MDFTEQRRQYFELLAGEYPEQRYQDFIETHTRFIPREFVQNHGVGMSLVLRKLTFGADYKSDFFYFSKSSDDWNAVFIEIEKPSSRFFAGNTNNFHRDFLNAIQQINEWRAWLSNAANKAGFLTSVSTIQIPRSMARNPTHCKFVLVFGRRSEYDGNETRRGLVHGMEQHDFKIITFDSLAEDIESKTKLSIAARHNKYIDILTDEVTNPHLYGWAEPTELRVSPTLKAELEKGSYTYRIVDGKTVNALQWAASRVRVRSK